MKTLILTDEAYAKLIQVPRAKVLLLARFDHDLPEAEALHRMARAGETPEVFELQRSRMEAVSDATEAMRETMHGLIRDAHTRGVGVTWLARWSGYSVPRVYEILAAR